MKRKSSWLAENIDREYRRNERMKRKIREQKRRKEEGDEKDKE